MHPCESCMIKDIIMRKAIRCTLMGGSAVANRPVRITGQKDWILNWRQQTHALIEESSVRVPGES
jgi:hypothetical protein